MDSYLAVWKKFAQFSGRSRRKEYWMFILFNLLVMFALTFIDALTGVPVLTMVYGLLVFIPSLSVAVRRLHDTGRSGWWLLIGLIPLVSLILIYFLACDSETESNDFGDNPKAIA